MFGETEQQIEIRSTWIETSIHKAETFIYNLQLQKAIDSIRITMQNSEFQRCSEKQKFNAYAVLLDAYRLALDYKMYDCITDELHQSGIHDDREYFMSAMRYYEALNYTKAEEYAEKALEINPNGNKERVLLRIVRICQNHDMQISDLSEFIASNDELLIQPKDKNEEGALYSLLGFVLGMKFKETGRAIRCYNKAFQINGKYSNIEELAVFYYLHALRNAFIEECKDRVDPIRIDMAALEKSRNAFLMVLNEGDQLWKKGTIRRVGPQMFKCFYFSRDNYRVYKHYEDLMCYSEFFDSNMLRDLQCSYLSVAVKIRPVDLNHFKGLSDYDRKYFELFSQLYKGLSEFRDESIYTPGINERELYKLIHTGEHHLQQLTDMSDGENLELDTIHSVFINLYGVGIRKYAWNSLIEVKRHEDAIRNPLAKEVIHLYVRELEIKDFEASAKDFEQFFEKKNDIHAFNELCCFYTRNGQIQKTKELYDSLLEKRHYLVENQPEFFYREYIFFYIEHHFDLISPMKCFVEHGDEIADVFLRILVEMELDFACCIFNNPEKMLDNAKIMFEEGLMNSQKYKDQCLIINMVNLRPLEARKYIETSHEIDERQASNYERLFFAWNRHPIIPDSNWDSMQKYSKAYLDTIYTGEGWRKLPEDILNRFGTRKNKTLVIDLWAMYYLQKCHLMNVLWCFEKVYVTHMTVYVALFEISKVRDDTIRKILFYFQVEPKYVLKSPSIKDQLDSRSQNIQYAEIHHALQLAKILNCPALVGDFKNEIPEHFKDLVIRPNDAEVVWEYMENEE